MLKNKIIFITGASSGIGEACAIEAAKSGAKVLLCARRLEKIEKLSQQLTDEYGASVFGFECDVQNRDQIQAQLSALPKVWRDIDVLVNNAGLAAGLDTIQDADVSDWESMIDTNVKGLLYVTKSVLPVMIAKNAGHIVNIGSVAGHTVYPKGVVYCATKKAVLAISEGLRMDLFGKNIRVTSVDPGTVETNFSNVRFKNDTARAKKVYQGFMPLLAQDIADAVFYCLTRPLHVNVSNMIVMPTAQASVGMIAREPL